MRQGPHLRRSRGGRPGGGGGGGRRPKQSLFESNGPDVKVRGSASQVVEKYLALARDATISGDRVAAENYFQHADHYYRLQHAAETAAVPHRGGNGQEGAAEPDAGAPTNDAAQGNGANGAAQPTVMQIGPDLDKDEEEQDKSDPSDATSATG